MKEFIEVPASKISISKRRLVNNVGINDATYNVYSCLDGQVNRVCLYYIVWSRMIERCYNVKFQERNPAYKDCSVVKNWLTFSNFKSWMKSQDWKGKQLDKDLLVSENKEYGPSTCVFVSSQANSLLSGCDAARGKYPKGVSFNKNAGAFTARCSVNGVVKHIGLFSSATKAECAYLRFKITIVKEFAATQDAVVKKALICAADKMSARLISLM